MIIKELKQLKKQLENATKVSQLKLKHNEFIQHLNLVVYMDQDYNIEIELMDEEKDFKDFHMLIY